MKSRRLTASQSNGDTGGSSRSSRMSALGHKRTFHLSNAMSALPPKAGIAGRQELAVLMRARTLQGGGWVTTTGPSTHGVDCVDPAPF